MPRAERRITAAGVPFPAFNLREAGRPLLPKAVYLSVMTGAMTGKRGYNEEQENIYHAIGSLSSQGNDKEKNIRPGGR